MGRVSASRGVLGDQYFGGASLEAARSVPKGHLGLGDTAGLQASAFTQMPAIIILTCTGPC